MTKRRAFGIHYEQWLEEDANAPGWSEKSEISIRLTSDALTSGWLTRFGEHPIDYLVLSIIGLHARPLTDKDIELLEPLGIVTAEDRGRMFSYITDLGLANLIGKNRETVAEATKRLNDESRLTIRRLDRDAQIRLGGRFNGNKIYILSGSVAFRKEIVGRESVEKDSVERDISHRAGKSSTVTSEQPSTVLENPAPPDGKSVTNLNTLVVVDADQKEHIFDFRDEAVFGHFAAKKGNPYKPTGNDRKALKRLREAGYSLQQITAAIDEVFDRGDNPTTFAYCARIVEDYTPARRSPALPALPATPASPADLPEEIQTLANMIAPHLPERDPSVLPPSGVADLALTRSVSKGQALPNVGHRLKALADSCAEAARQNGATGADWLRDALQRSIGKDDPLAYAAAVLRAWVEHGPAADFRPTRDGYHPPRRDSTAAPNSAGANGDSDDSDPYRVIDPPLLPMPEK